MRRIVAVAATAVLCGAAAVGLAVPATAAATVGSYQAATPTRLLDTRPSQGGHGAVGPGQTVSFVVPSGPGSSAVLNLTVTAPTSAGYIVAYADGAPRPGVSNLNFVAGQTVPNLAVVPVGSDGKVALSNQSPGTVQLVADVSGYFTPGDPVYAGNLGALAPARLLDTRSGGGPVRSGQTVTLSVGGRGGVPLTGVRAVVLNVTVTAPTQPGNIIVWAGGTRPLVSNLNFVAGQTVPNLVVAPVSANGTVSLYNSSLGTVQLIADVSGYLLSDNLSLPPASVGRYVRNISGASSDVSTMQSEGAADAAAGAKFVLLDIGAQLNNKTGVQLTDGNTSLTYAQLVTAVQAYLSGFGAVSGSTIAVGTNNDAQDWTNYPAAQRGSDWTQKVVNLLTPGAGVSVVGADDIEPLFFSTEPQAEQWEAAYLNAATTKKLIFVGSADGCPTTYGSTGGTCAAGWTEANINKLAGGLDPTRISAMPQIYTPALAVQWANIYATGGHTLSFAGALTEYAACPTGSSPGCNGLAALPPPQGWAALYHALSTVVPAPSLPAVADLRIDN